MKYDEIEKRILTYLLFYYITWSDNPNASRLFFSFKFLWRKNRGKLAEISDFAGVGDRSRDLSHSGQVSEPLHYGDGLANPKEFAHHLHAHEWREQIDPGTMHHTHGFS